MCPTHSKRSCHRPYTESVGSPPNIIKYIVKDHQESVRIDYYISKKYKYLSRTKIKNLILNNKLKINDSLVNDPARKIKNEDNIILEIDEEEKLSLKPFDYKLNILFEDEDFIVAYLSIVQHISKISE